LLHSGVGLQLLLAFLFVPRCVGAAIGRPITGITAG